MSSIIVALIFIMEWIFGMITPPMKRETMIRLSTVSSACPGLNYKHITA